MMYVPEGCAHGFVTLQDDTEALYLVSAFYGPDEERGVRFNDPRFAIAWPIEPAEVSAKDKGWPDFDPQFHGIERLRGLV
jgi:dTDP-4-dehydrorhamnose 3,5-epimerase